MSETPRRSILILAAVLLLQACTDAISYKRDELCQYIPARDGFDAAKQVEGKVAVVYKGVLYNPATKNGCQLDGYVGGSSVKHYFPEEMYARTPEELDTLILVELANGDFIQTSKYQMTQSGGWTVDVFTGVLKISMIDYRTSTRVRNTVRVLAKVPDKIELGDLKHAKDSSANSEYVIEPTTAEIQAALKEFSDKAIIDK